MSKAIALCPHCKHCREPIRPSAFAAGAVLSGGQFGSATRELAEQERERQDEESRVYDGVLFDSAPQFFPWCAKFTLSSEEIDELNRRLRAGDDRLARAAVHDRLARIDGTLGALVPLYALCLRQNPEPYECGGFEERA